MIDIKNFSIQGKSLNYFEYKVKGARASEKKRKVNRPFTINAKYLEIIFPKDHKCPVSGDDFDLKSKWQTPSLDRIDNNKGYEKGNVIFVSRRVNTIKNHVDAKTILKIVDFYKRLENGKYKKQ